MQTNRSLPIRSWPLAILLASLGMLGPFSIDTYLPAFNEMADDLGASLLQIQQSLTVYLFAFAVLTLWHGAISDSVGRRPVILVSLLIYAAASLGCAIAANIETLFFFRILQGVSAGAGIVVGRAIIRDRYQGPEAQKLMSQVTLVFGLAPALAPIIGGQLQQLWGWRSIFVFLLLITLGLIAWCNFKLPETHSKHDRQPLQPKILLRNYWRVFIHREFQLLAGLIAFNFAGFFVYIPAAPIFLMQHLSVSNTGFAWLFLPGIAGIMLGAFLSGKLADKLTPKQTITWGFLLLFAAALANVVLCFLFTPRLPWNILPIFVYTCGMSLVMPSATLLLLDYFPNLRGLASSLMGFTHTALATIVAGVVSPWLAQSVLGLALGMFALLLIAYILWFSYSHQRKNYE